MCSDSSKKGSHQMLTSKVCQQKPHSMERRRRKSARSRAGPQSQPSQVSFCPRLARNAPQRWSLTRERKIGYSDAKSFGQQCVAAPESKSTQGSESSNVDATKCSSKATYLKDVF